MPTGVRGLAASLLESPAHHSGGEGKASIVIENAAAFGTRPGQSACMPTGVRGLAASLLESPAHPSRGEGKQLALTTQG